MFGFTGPRRKRSILAIIGVVVLLIGSWWWWEVRDPTYQGRRASLWMDDYSRAFGVKASTGIIPQPTATELKPIYEQGEKAKLALSHLSDRAFPALMRKVNARDSQHRFLLIKKLESLPKKAQDLLPRFVWKTGRTSFEQHRIAEDVFDFLGSKAKPVVPELIDCLKSDDWQVVFTAARILSNLNKNPEPALPLLIPLLSHANEWVRRSSLDAISAMGQEASNAVPFVLPLLNDTDCRSSALSALGRIHNDPPLVLPIFEKEMEQPWRDYDVLLWNLGLMGKGAKRTVPTIKALLTNDNSYLRSLASNALAKIEGSPELQPGNKDVP